MSERYPGGFINRSAPVVVGPTGGEGGSAPGVWTLEQASYYISQGTWPKPLLPRTMWSTGYNAYGQIGDNTVIDRSSPVQVSGSQSWSVMGGGNGQINAISTTGGLFGWGSNNTGQLGLGNTVDVSSPVQVGALTNWTDVKNGWKHGVAIKTDGTMWSWGSNQFGQLGQNSVYYANKSSPVQIGSLSTWLRVACSAYSSTAIKTDGTMWSWGKNDYGQLGLNIASTTNKSSPTQVGSLTTWSKVFASTGNGVMAIKTDGTIWAYGYNIAGRLGDGTVVNRSSPVQIGALTTWASAAPAQSASYFIKNDGTMWSTGANSFGQLALNLTTSYTYRSSPTQIGSLTTWSAVTGGQSFMGALKTDGTIWACGYNILGVLGQNVGFGGNKSSPVQIGSATNWTDIVAGGTNLNMIKKG